MRLKQPEVPGIWGSWDPATGPQRDSGSRDWPEYDRTLVKPGEGLDAGGIAQDQEQETSSVAAPATKGGIDPDSTTNTSGMQNDTHVHMEGTTRQQNSDAQDSSTLADLYGIDVNRPEQLEAKSGEALKTGPGWFPFGLWNR